MPQLIMTRLFAFTLLLLFTLQSEVWAENDWPQWQGPNRDLTNSEAGLLKEWPEQGPKRVWLFEDCGIGYGGPAIVDGKLYILSGRGETCFLLKLNANTGEELFATPLGKVLTEEHYPGFASPWGSGPRSTPTVERDRVYVLTGGGVLACVSATSGSVLWHTSMQEQGGKLPNWGYTESPLVTDNLVLVTPGVAAEDEFDSSRTSREDAGTIIALDKMTGEVRWRSTDLKDKAHYSSIMAADVHGKRQFIQLLEKRAVGLDAENGKLLWETPWPGRVAVIPTPVIADNQVYLTAGYGAGSKLIKINRDDTVEEIYDNKVMKNHHGGVIKLGDYLYGYSDGAGWICQDFKTGEQIWRERSALGKGALGYADGMLYLISEDDGEVVLLEPNSEEWRERGRFTLQPQTEIRTEKGRIWTHPVIVNGKLYLRDQDILACYKVAESN